jgi:hypothetical protein
VPGIKTKLAVDSGHSKRILTTEFGHAREHSCHKALVVLTTCRFVSFDNPILRPFPLCYESILHSRRHRLKPDLGP